MALADSSRMGAAIWLEQNGNNFRNLVKMNPSILEEFEEAEKNQRKLAALLRELSDKLESVSKTNESQKETLH